MARVADRRPIPTRPDPAGMRPCRSSASAEGKQAGKLREGADVIVQQGKKLIAGNGTDIVDRSTEASKQVYQETKRENLGG